MANCVTTVKRVEFDVSDEQVTKVVVEIDFDGDCPIGVYRRYHKTFPARHSMVDIVTMEGGVTDYLNWDAG